MDFLKLFPVCQCVRYVTDGVYRDFTHRLQPGFQVFQLTQLLFTFPDLVFQYCFLLIKKQRNDTTRIFFGKKLSD